MKKIRITCLDSLHGAHSKPSAGAWIASQIALALIFLAAFCFGSSTQAQTVTLLATNQNIYAGGGTFKGIYTNSQLRVTLSGTGTTPVTLSVSGAPAGATILFSTNGYAFAANPLDITNSWNPVWYSVAVTNVAPGIYPLTISASGAATGSVNVNLIVGNRWINTTPAGDVSWSTGANWSKGSAPSAGDDVMFQDAGNTNFVNGSYTLDSLTFLPVQNGTNQNMLIGPGQTVTVTNGFAVNVDSVSANNKTYTLNVYGAGASLVVTNPTTDFTINGDNTGGSGTTVTMTNLDNFSVTAGRIGMGDWTMAKQGGAGANLVVVSLAKTNLLAAYTPGDYGLTNLFPKFSISTFQNGDPFNNGSANTINLGINTSIQAESLGSGLDRAGAGGNIIRFNPVFTNGVAATMPVVSFRNTDGGRMGLVGVGIDSGASTPGSNAKGTLNFNGGIVDMLVDTMWLGRDRSATTNTGAASIGNLTFSSGIVDVNTLIAGYQVFTNNSSAQGVITVGGSPTTNAILSVNSNLVLGVYAGDFGGNQAASGNGQVTIATNGFVRANQITIGQPPSGAQAANRITIANGGTLDVTNNVGDATNTLPSLIVNSGTILLHLNGAKTLIYASNVTALAGSKIGIASVDNQILGTPIPVIHFTNGVTPNNLGWNGVAPAGLNVVIGASADSVFVTLNTGAPKTVRWVGNVNNIWDTVTKNWIDTATGLSTNFNIGDQVIFDDTASQFSVDVQGDILPSQAGTGIAMTNDTHGYTFTTTGSGRLLGGTALVKQGANSLAVDVYSEFAANLAQGSITNTSLGTIGAVIAAAGTTFANFGTVLGNVSSSSVAVNTGTIVGALTAKTSGFVTNGVGGTVKGGLGSETGSFLYNAGTWTGIGSASIATNATFVNAGTIANGGNNAGSLTVNGTFEDLGTAAGTSLNLATLTIASGGTFIPGGDGIGTTTIQSDGTGFDGRVVFATGSTNIFKVDVNAPQKNTLLTSGYISWGPNQNVLIQNGGFLVISNIGTTAFAPAQTFQLVQNNFGGNPFDAGLNTTNSLSNIIPDVPAPGLTWDLSQLIHGGLISIKSIPTVATNLTASITTGITISTNVPPITNNVVITLLSWPQEYTGWKLQELVNGPTNGLENTNWQYVAAAQFTNSMAFTNAQTPGSVFFRMVSP
jgi:hypothetical protein